MKKFNLLFPIFLAAVMVFVLAAPLSVKAEGVSPPERTIPVTGSGLVNVASGAVSHFVLKDGNAVLMPSMELRGLKAAITSETPKTLPAALPEDYHFVDAVSVSLVQGGMAVDKLPEKAKLAVSFGEDAEFVACDHTFSILHWDFAKGWEEIAENTLEAASHVAGLYVLAVK
jgi:hypothetical protein